MTRPSHGRGHEFDSRLEYVLYFFCSLRGSYLCFIGTAFTASVMFADERFVLKNTYSLCAESFYHEHTSLLLDTTLLVKRRRQS